MDLQTILIATHLSSFLVWALTVHLIYKNKGRNANVMRILISMVIIFFWCASMYKEIFLGGNQTPYILYVLFGLVQGAFFEFSIKDLISIIQKK